MSRYIVTNQARQDLDDIWEYIARDNINAANKVEDEIINMCSNLANNPYMGSIRADLTSLSVRFISVHSYLIVYKADKSPIQIVRILSSYRNVPVILDKP